MMKIFFHPRDKTEILPSSIAKDTPTVKPALCRASGYKSSGKL
jgi:hypothetical protein